MPQEVPAIKVTRVLNAVAAGTTAQNGSVIDMADYEGVVFLAAFGALTATQVTSLKAQHGDQSNLSDAADLAGTLTGPMADADSNKTLVLDINRPVKRYIRVVVNRATANAVIDGVVAIQYSPKKKPTTNDATTTSATKSVVSPAAGTP
jgi:hypothetical protein